ncbi:Polysaccharide biosynthesis protein [Nitrosococcus oceani ATCC 19707]|uniref:Polysaccharide biosynthesis protein n=2 Tax=Nitrosococcus oceani TaxID=1229 RepID=Q3JAZ8_NITOC|nr:oligosaccharide flippase family protein [Nitrosococcus oceani]ABA57998.1 Polysaccharide biosynthesis protein [Nitrosococcus oceani ATCC 19707]EDZ68170.1 MatE family [Nitrosococcus oceani AFC27]KFI19565.1 polysaccharide biosynthesis protein [Nitrosococcus oceani C-27]GEM21043.1 polysaccharide biosynthesis protein [Nitrosococcus oceani]
MVEVVARAVTLRHRLLPALLAAGGVLPAGLALNYALNVVLARVLPIEGYGLFAYAQSLASVLALAAALGFSSSMMRLVAAYRAQGRDALLLGAVKGSFALVCLAGVAIALVLLAIAWLAPAHRSGLLWTSLLLLPLTIDVWRESTMRGLHRTVAAILPRQVFLPLLTLLVVLALGLEDTGLILATFAGILVALELVGLLQLRKALGFLSTVQPRWAMRQWLRVSLPMGLAALANLGINRWDVVVLGFIAGLDVAGPYAAAARTALLASLVLRVVNLVVGPMLAELYHRGDHHHFRRLLLLGAGGATVLGLPLYLAALLYPEQILSLFGPGYQDAALLLQILATAQFVNLATGPVGLALTMARHEMSNLRVTMLAGVVSLIALLVLVPWQGAVGAAVATASATVLLNVAAAIVAWRHFRIRP